MDEMSHRCNEMFFAALENLLPKCYNNLNYKSIPDDKLIREICGTRRFHSSNCPREALRTGGRT